jgi:hypothetical protein
MLLLILFILALNSCGNLALLSYYELKDKTEKNNDTPDIYIVGYYTIGNNYPCYWKNENRIDLQYITLTNATDMSIYVDDNNDVYCSGCDKNGGSVEKACYWKNNSIHFVNTSTTYDSKIKSIAVVNGVIYSCGTENNQPCYWVNEKQHFLSYPSPFTSAEANSIFIDKDNFDFYIAGNYTGSGVWRACYWKNGGECITLDTSSNNSFGYAVYQYLGKSYISGSYNISGNKTPCYWEDGIMTNLPYTGSNPHYANSITVYRGNVYASGIFNDVSAVCWKNNDSSPFLIDTSATTKSFGSTIFNNDIYLAGSVSNSTACYWKNHTRIPLSVPSGTTNSEARGIFVKAKSK